MVDQPLSVRRKCGATYNESWLVHKDLGRGPHCHVTASQTAAPPLLATEKERVSPSGDHDSGQCIVPSSAVVRRFRHTTSVRGLPVNAGRLLSIRGKAHPLSIRRPYRTNVVTFKRQPPNLGVPRPGRKPKCRCPHCWPLQQRVCCRLARASDSDKPLAARQGVPLHRYDLLRPECCCQQQLFPERKSVSHALRIHSLRWPFDLY